MSKIKAFFKGLIRRVRQMGELLSTIGVFLIPFGFWLIVEYSNNKWMGVISVVLGLFFLYTALWIIRTKEKTEREEKIQALQLRYLELKEIDRKFNAVIEELKALSKAPNKDKEGSK